MTNPYIRVVKFDESLDGDGALHVSMTAYDGSDVEIPGMHSTVTIPGEVLLNIVSTLPDQPAMQDAYDLIIRIAGRYDPRFSPQAIGERIAHNQQAKDARTALLGILAQFGLPENNIDVPIA